VDDADEPDERTGPIAVALVDDQDLMRSGLRILVESDPDLEVVGEAGTGVEALDPVKRTHPEARAVVAGYWG
jgi:DNA-binding NarL/FixJ family response regulator